MNAKKTFNSFRSELSSAFPAVEFASYKDTDPADFEEFISNDILKVCRKIRLCLIMNYRVWC